jgi:subtilase family serine protease
MRKPVSCAVSLGLATLLAAAGNVRAQESAQAADAGPEVSAVRACDLGNDDEDTMRCHAWIVSDEAGNAKVFDGPAGFHPADLREAYNIHKNGDKSTTIAIVDAYHYPTAEADLNVYRKMFGIPPCTKANGCFQQVNQHGGTRKYPAVNVGWNQEEALDIEMASAICPKCRILIVEADNNHSPNLGRAVDTAVAMGAHVVSNSYGGKEHWGPAQEYHYDHPGVAITASSGDSGLGPQFPATSPHVTAVGGTLLRVDASTQRGWTEIAWAGAGSGCSQYFPKPAWQHDRGCAQRMEADVSAVASPASGVAVYGPTGSGSRWMVFGGTSVAAPIIAGFYGVNDGTVTYGKNPYRHTDALYDVTSGSNGQCNGRYRCTARVGYDGPTGWGTPNGDDAFGD